MKKNNKSKMISLKKEKLLREVKVKYYKILLKFARRID